MTQNLRKTSANSLNNPVAKTEIENQRKEFEFGKARLTCVRRGDGKRRCKIIPFTVLPHSEETCQHAPVKYIDADD